MPAAAINVNILGEEDGKTGSRRRHTLPIGPMPEASPGTVSGRSDTVREVEKASVGAERAAEKTSDAPSTDPPRSASARRSRPEREALRVDEVRSKRLSVRGVIEPQPRIVDAKRISKAPLDTREAFILQLIDGQTTVSELVDISGLALEELDRILARLIRLGIVAV